MATLLAEFNAYLDTETANPPTDLVGYRQHSLWLSPDEVAAPIEDLRAAIIPRMRNKPTPTAPNTYSAQYFSRSPNLSPADSTTPDQLGKSPRSPYAETHHGIKMAAPTCRDRH